MNDVNIPTWLQWLRSHIGESEKTGEQATPFETEIFSHTDCPFDGVELAGCAATMCAALEENGFPSPHNAAAISFRDYGIACDLKPGAILVFEWSENEHHVTCCSSIINSGIVACIGGNQSSTLKISNYPSSKIIACRWPG